MHNIGACGSGHARVIKEKNTNQIIILHTCIYNIVYPVIKNR